MKSSSDSVAQYLSARAKLVKEQSDIVARLNEISKVLGGFGDFDFGKGLLVGHKGSLRLVYPSVNGRTLDLHRKLAGPFSLNLLDARKWLLQTAANHRSRRQRGGPGYPRIQEKVKAKTGSKPLS